MARCRTKIFNSLVTSATRSEAGHSGAEVVAGLEGEPAPRIPSTLAPRTIRHVYAILATMFRTGVADELIIATPCVLPKGILPKKVDKDPSFRANAIFTREEVEQLAFDVRLLEDRRLLYALTGLAGLRHSEASGLRWRHYQAGLDPLDANDLDRTKSQVPRRVPVHPTLAALLEEWRTAGWERTYGAPTAVPPLPRTSSSPHAT